VRDETVSHHETLFECEDRKGIFYTLVSFKKHYKMDNGGQQPPFSPIGTRYSQGGNHPGSVSEPDRVAPVSSTSVPPRTVLQLWKDVAQVFDTQKQGKCNIDSFSCLTDEGYIQSYSRPPVLF
jgi:hypothetical protein